MTIPEYHKYCEVTKALFEYMNGRVNTMNSQCTLQLEMFDLITGTFGNIRYPNHIVIYVGTIINAWNDEWDPYINKNDWICTCIAWAVSHELHHADQLISMMTYNRNQEYKDKVEGDVELASYNWVARHSKEIGVVCECNIIISDLISDGIPKVGNYKKASPKEFYIQTIANILLRDLNVFQDIADTFNNDAITDIILVFNDIDSVVIKTNGIYVDSNINLFSQMVYKYSGYWDLYSISCEIIIKAMEDNSRILAYVRFKISGCLVNPMTFYK